MIPQPSTPDDLESGSGATQAADAALDPASSTETKGRRTLVGRLLRNHKTWLLLILLAAVVLRFAWSLYVECDPRDVWRWDMTIYDYHADRIAAGAGFIDWVGAPSAHWPPGYPAALAPIYKLTDSSLLAARLFNASLSSFAVLLTYLIGARVFGRGAGLAGALVLAFFPNQIMFNSLTMTEPLFAALFSLILLLTLHLLLGRSPPRLWQAALVGIAIGATALVRGEVLLLFAVIAPVLFLRWRSWKGVAGSVLGLTLGMAVVIAPWTVRNTIKMHEPLLISTSAAEALWVGHHEGADGRIADFSPIYDRYESLPNPEKEVKIYNAAMRASLEYMRENPLADLKLIPQKLLALYETDGSAIRWMQLGALTVTHDNGIRLRAISNIYYWLALAVGVLGVRSWFSLRDPSKALLVAMLLYWSFIFGFVFFGDQRFHFALVPVFSIWAGASIVAGGRLVLRRWRSLRLKPAAAVE